MTPMVYLTPHSAVMINYAIGKVVAVLILMQMCSSYAVYGSVCGASVLMISTVVCVVCVIVFIKHKHKGTVSVYWYCMK